MWIDRFYIVYFIYSPYGPMDCKILNWCRMVSGDFFGGKTIMSEREVVLCASGVIYSHNHYHIHTHTHHHTLPYTHKNVIFI